MRPLPPDFRAGVRDVAPTLPAIVSFGVVVGAAALAIGLSLVQALGLSVVVFAGASQLAVIGLLGAGAPLAVVVSTALVINLRMVMYSAGLAPYFREEPVRWRAPIAYLLVDQGYVMAALRYDADEAVDRRAYYFGLALPIWVTWVVGTVTGALVGTALPGWVPLDFAVPMVFLALLVPAVGDRATGAAAVAGGVVAVLGTGLPLNLGLLAGAGVGVATGLLVERGWAE
jgi:4-azaleucine resistance transporter AzlC